MNKKRRRHREISCRTCQIGLREFTESSWNQDRHLLEVTTDILQNHLVQTLYHQKESTICLRTFPKTQIVNVRKYSARPSSVISLLPTTKPSMKRENRGTIKGAQLWCKIWPPNGFKVTHAKQKKNTRNDEKSCEVSRQRFYTQTIHWNVFGKACGDLQWNYCASTPHQPETNGIAERAVGRVTEGTSSGLDERWWVESMECCCYLRTVQDLLPGGKFPHERCCEEQFSGPIIPFVAKVACHHQRKIRRGVISSARMYSQVFYMGCALYAGGSWRSSGE